MKKEVLIIMAAIVLISLHSCEDDENETKISSFGSDDSHKTGENCMECHKSGGDGEGWFTVAGTVYNSTQTTVYPNATITLYTGSKGTGDLVAAIEVDKKGNFYTTEKVDFGNGLYTQVEGNNTTRDMISSIRHGKCNSCHGDSVDAIWTE